MGEGQHAEQPRWLVAIAYVLHKTPYVFPMIGGRKVEHLKQNVEALDISLSAEQIQRIDDANPIDLGFPYTVIVRTPTQLPDMSSVAELLYRDRVRKRRTLDRACHCILTTASPRGRR